MPKQEELAPWLATQAAAREPYPRKNLYFVGDEMDQVYDYCIWQAHIAGHTTIDGKVARGSATFITDILARTYLKSMLDTENIEAFTKWRTSEYKLDHQIIRPPEPHPELLYGQFFVHPRYASREEMQRAYLAYVKQLRAQKAARKAAMEESKERQ